jgi:CheY-like chemotaxis protein
MKRILVVEDNETNMYLIKFMLEKSGYEVIEAMAQLFTKSDSSCTGKDKLLS